MPSFKFVATVLVIALAAVWLSNNFGPIGRLVK